MQNIFEYTDTDLIKYDFCSYNPKITSIIIPQDVIVLLIATSKTLLDFGLNLLESDDLQINSIIAAQLNAIIETFPFYVKEFIITIDDIIKTFNGPVFVKCHRSPKDGLWSNSDKLSCYNGIDVITLLLKSERCMEDAILYINNGWPVRLYFQPFINVNVDNEFRVFLYKNQIVGISGVNSRKITTEISQICIMAIEGLKSKITYMDTYCVDLELFNLELCNLEYRIFEVNPFDMTTDLYWLTEEDFQ